MMNSFKVAPQVYRCSRLEKASKPFGLLAHVSISKQLDLNCDIAALLGFVKVKDLSPVITVASFEFHSEPINYEIAVRFDDQRGA
ncbi:hypothetical protein QWZ10_07465 [Paracoccus cavernae]|uniref:Uncharacterized protein n=1 Tax=Paracoccus cavernae TaxID=1571207 RepID=A0ABT8D8H3_9RHOB|nr:hypothetical protein [Paracoccus cavernae]